jgi:hypothetical protein
MERSLGICEYCLIHQRDSFFAHQVDHVIARKHGGPTSAANLAFACLPCNLAKGSDLGSILSTPRRLVRLFHPLEDSWAAHFRHEGAAIRSLSDVGEVTSRLLGFNSRERIAERRLMIREGKYPSIEALTRFPVI